MTTPNNTPYSPAAIANAITRALANANDRPQPTNEAYCSPQYYAAIAQSFRNSAWKHLHEGDLSQASYEAWALVAETVKAISAHHGAIIHTYSPVREVGRELARLVDDSGDAATRHWLNVSFLLAHSLYSDSYYDVNPIEDAVHDGLLQCEELSQRLYDLFWPEAPTTTARQ